MRHSNVRNFWLFWHEGLTDTFDVIATVERGSFMSTVEFYRDVIKTLGDHGADVSWVCFETLTAKPNADPDADPKWGAESAAEIFLDVANSLPGPYFIGVADGFERFVIAKPKDSVIEPPDPVIRHGKWLLVDDITLERYTPIAITRIYCEPTSEYHIPLERSYRSAIRALLNHGAKVTYLDWHSDIWHFPRVPSLPAAFREAVATLPKPYRAGIGEDLLRFYVLKPL